MFAIVLTGLILWAFRKGDKLADAKAEAREMKSENKALEALNETNDEIDSLGDDAVLERLHRRAESRD